MLTSVFSRDRFTSGVHGHFTDGLVNGPLVLFSDDRLEDGGGVRRSRHRFPDGVELVSILWPRPDLRLQRLGRLGRGPTDRSIVDRGVENLGGVRNALDFEVGGEIVKLDRRQMVLSRIHIGGFNLEGNLREHA